VLFSTAFPTGQDCPLQTLLRPVCGGSLEPCKITPTIIRGGSELREDHRTSVRRGPEAKLDS
jgi:hypothetical protein